jgi:hypothetical protein
MRLPLAEGDCDMLSNGGLNNTACGSTRSRAFFVLFLTAFFHVFFFGRGLTQTLSFGVPVFFDVGSSAFPDPFSVAAGDFNGDGKLDLAVANTGDDTVSILLGNGSGLFARSIDVAVGSGPVSVMAGDLNHDQVADLVVANEGGNSISIILGNMKSTFSATNIAVTGGPTAVVIGHFDDDNHPDLAVARFASDNVRVLLGNGNGAFSSGGTFGVGEGPILIAAGDFNGDQKLDLVVANYSEGSISILLGDGMGEFGSPATFSVGDGSSSSALPRSVAVGHFNGDVQLDVAVGDVNLQRVIVLAGDGMGSLHPPSVVVSKAAYSLQAIDINGDTLLDLVFTDRPADTISVALGLGTGSFAAAQDFLAGGGPWGLAVGDFDIDGQPDLVSTNTYNTRKCYRAVEQHKRCSWYGGKLSG